MGSFEASKSPKPRIPLRPNDAWIIVNSALPTSHVITNHQSILVRENSPDRVSFVSFPPTLSGSCTRPSPLLPCITNFNVAPVTLCYTLHFRNWLFFGSSHAYNIKYRSGYLRHLIILTGIIFPCFFTPTGIINTPILTKNIQNAILSQPKKQ